LVPQVRPCHLGGVTACVPLAAGAALVAMAVLPATPFGGEPFFFEWVGSFLAFVGLSYLAGSRLALPLAGAVLVGGCLGDLALLGGLTPVGWAVVNYMVFVHSVVGALVGALLRRGSFHQEMTLMGREPRSHNV